MNRLVIADEPNPRLTNNLPNEGIFVGMGSGNTPIMIVGMYMSSYEKAVFKAIALKQSTSYIDHLTFDSFQNAIEHYIKTGYTMIWFENWEELLMYQPFIDELRYIPSRKQHIVQSTRWKETGEK